MRTRIALGAIGVVVVILSHHYVLSAHMRTLHQTTQAVSETRSVWDGVYTAEQAKRGEEVYRGECSICHGAKLEGVEDAPSLAGKSFVDGWVVGQFDLENISGCDTTGILTELVGILSCSYSMTV